MAVAVAAVDMILIHVGVAVSALLHVLLITGSLVTIVVIVSV